MSDSKTFTIVLAILAVLVAHFYPELKSLFYKNSDYIEPIDAPSQQQQRDAVEREIIASWSALIRPPNRNINRSLKIAIGLNTNVDLIVSGVELFTELGSKFNTAATPVNHKSLNNLNQFKETFAHFFRKGSAAERSLASLADFETVLAAVKNLKNQQWFIGGNAALMAQSMSKRLVDSSGEVLLVGPIGPKLKQLLNKNIRTPSSSLIENDEVHLILEYDSSEVFESAQAPNANRFIVSHDVYNSRMEMLDEFFNITATYQPDIVIISGLHLLESQSEEFRIGRLDRFKHLLSEQRTARNVIHLELASIGDKTLMKNILDAKILQEINSLGLNEQELLFLAHADERAPHSNYYLEISDQPELFKVIDILEYILTTYGQSVRNSGSRLTRIHFHSLSFHLIAEVTTGGRDNKEPWSNSVAALMSGAKIASKQACGFEFYDEESNRQLESLVELKIAYDFDKTNSKNIFFTAQDGGQNRLLQLNSSHPVLELNRGNIKFLYTPVLVCKRPSKTVGLGDAISSSGLLYAMLNSEI